MVVRVVAGSVILGIITTIHSPGRLLVREDGKEPEISAIEKAKVDALPAPAKEDQAQQYDEAEVEEEPGTAEVVSLDAFRKKS